jgi:hypothetical protein
MISGVCNVVEQPSFYILFELQKEKYVVIITIIIKYKNYNTSPCKSII